MESKKRFRSLTSSKDFLQLKSTGQSIHVNSWLLANVKKTQLDQIRCGWTIPRLVGPAVMRNRFKRWGREYFRKWSAENHKSLDLNLIFKRKEKGFYDSVSHKDFDGALDKLVAKMSRYLE